MNDPALDLLRPGKPQQLYLPLAPQEVITALCRARDAEKHLKVRVDGDAFQVAERQRWSGTYPGRVDGVVEASPPGSRVVYKREVVPGVRIVLFFWAIASVALLLFSGILVIASVLTRQYISIIFSLWPAFIVVVVWLNWRRLSLRGTELERVLGRHLGTPQGR